VNDYTCACGHEAVTAEDLADHVGDMMIPDDDTARDGVRHAEAADLAGHRCLCGFPAEAAPALDDHLLAVFTASGAVGRDGRRHSILGM
jgi:hypothetical protein